MGNRAFQVVLVLHILAAIVGFGTFAASAALGMKARASKGPVGAAVGQAGFDVFSRMGEWAIYAVPVFGILAVLLSEDAFKFSDAWISLSFLIYIVAVGVLHALYLPSTRRANELMAAGSGQAAALEAVGKKAAMASAIVNLSWALVLVLMVTKPGL